MKDSGNTQPQMAFTGLTAQAETLEGLSTVITKKISG
jgi:hypothetical protein